VPFRLPGRLKQAHRKPQPLRPIVQIQPGPIVTDLGQARPGGGVARRPTMSLFRDG